jgi:hypothetical protein
MRTKYVQITNIKKNKLMKKMILKRMRKYKAIKVKNIMNVPNLINL